MVIATPGRGAGALPALDLVSSSILSISGVGLAIIGIRSIRDRILGRHPAAPVSFPAGRCHSCGYDTTGLVRGTVACPECGAILAHIPSESRSPGVPP